MRTTESGLIGGPCLPPRVFGGSLMPLMGILVHSSDRSWDLDK